MVEKHWIGTQEAADLFSIHLQTLKNWCAERRIDPRCGKKMGGRWKFRRDIVLTEGILLKNQNN